MLQPSQQGAAGGLFGDGPRRAEKIKGGHTVGKKTIGSRRPWPGSLPGLPGIPPDAPPGAQYAKDWTMLIILADAKQAATLLELLFPPDSSLPQ